MNLLKVLELLALLWMPYQISAAPGCSDNEGLYVAHYQKALIGHTFLSRPRTSRAKCMMLCYRQSRCLSFNHEDRSGTCQLNSETREESPESLQQSVGFLYFEGLKPRARGTKKITTASVKPGADAADLATTVSSTESCSCDPFGMESGAILDHQITAANVLDDDYESYGPQLARLNSESAWCGGDGQTWIQVNFNQTVYFCGLIVQRHANGNDFLFELSLSFDAEANWSSYRANSKFASSAPTNRDVTIQLPYLVHSTFIRVHPSSWNNGKCVRFEILGCI